MSIPKLHKRYMDAIKYATKAIKESLLPVTYTILYGSCAKGKPKYNSDVDILLVVNDIVIKDRNNIRIFRKLANELREVSDMASIDLKIISLSNWNKNNTIYLKNVHKEGIEL